MNDFLWILLGILFIVFIVAACYMMYRRYYYKPISRPKSICGGGLIEFSGEGLTDTTGTFGVGVSFDATGKADGHFVHAFNSPAEKGNIQSKIDHVTFTEGAVELKSNDPVVGNIVTRFEMPDAFKIRFLTPQKIGEKEVSSIEGKLSPTSVVEFHY